MAFVKIYVDILVSQKLRLEGAVLRAVAHETALFGVVKAVKRTVAT